MIYHRDRQDLQRPMQKKNPIKMKVRFAARSYGMERKSETRKGLGESLGR